MEIDRVLSLNISLLKALWTAPETANPTSVPALEEFNRTGNSPLRYGGLTLIDVAGVLNWYAEKIPGASECADEWVNGLAIAHALTLLTISRRRKSFTRLPGCPNKSKTLERRWWILNRAWEALTEEGKVIPVDVDAEAIAILEGLMFANVGEGRTSLRQWSLDSGPIQDNWCPYSEIPSNWEEELMAEL
jgi:hypothetical protein